MLRRFGAVAAVLVLLSGFSAAPYTHVHHAIDTSDEHHPHGEAVVHSHATPHAHPDSDEPSDSDEQRERRWSVDCFLFQPSAPGTPVLPALLISARFVVEMPAVWIGRQRLQPVAHGPPDVVPAALRAPPSVLPAFA